MENEGDEENVEEKEEEKDEEQVEEARRRIKSTTRASDQLLLQHSASGLQRPAAILSVLKAIDRVVGHLCPHALLPLLLPDYCLCTV